LVRPIRLIGTVPLIRIVLLLIGIVPLIGVVALCLPAILVFGCHDRIGGKVDSMP
jgi:hypothetical protein